MDAGDEACRRRRLTSVLRLVQLTVVVGLLWKIQFFVWTDKVYQDFPLSDPFFPDWLEWQWTLRAAFFAAVATAAGAVFARGRNWLVGLASVELLALSVLLLHQGSYNDATFLTTWWAVVWCLWVSSQEHVSDVALTCRRAARLGCAILSLVMLGASVGKWTVEYWSGDVLYEIYFRDRDFWLFNGLRKQYDLPQLQQLAMWHSRMVVTIETIAGLTLWCLPTRVAGWFALVLMLLIPLTNNFLLFSVTWSLVGLSVAVIRLSARR